MDNKELAERIANDENNFQDGSSFWFGFSNSKDVAEKTVALLNKVLAGSGAKAQWEIGRNYNLKGKDYGIAIMGFTQKSAKFLKKKYGIEVEE